jgi:holo-ACP synthase CitX
MNQSINMTAMDILNSKEDRYRLRLNRTEGYECVIELTLNIPGTPKRGFIWENIFEKSVALISQHVPAQLLKSLSDSAGYYALFYSDANPIIAKQKTCFIEQTCKWGRLLDIDCYRNQVKISRDEIGLQERKCILCNCPHSYCIETHRHSLNELREAAELIAKNIK